MTKDDKFEIGLTLNKIAMMLSDEDFRKVKDLLKHIEQIVAQQADTPQTECRTCKWAEVSWTSHYCDDCKAHNKYEPNDTPQTDLLVKSPRKSRESHEIDTPQTDWYCYITEDRDTQVLDAWQTERSE